MGCIVFKIFSWTAYCSSYWIDLISSYLCVILYVALGTGGKAGLATHVHVHTEKFYNTNYRCLKNSKYVLYHWKWQPPFRVDCYILLIRRKADITVKYRKIISPGIEGLLFLKLVEHSGKRARRRKTDEKHQQMAWTQPQTSQDCAALVPRVVLLANNRETEIKKNVVCE